MSASELQRWRIYDAIEPIGHKRDDINTARVLNMLVRMLGSRKARPKVSDFLVDWWDEQPSQSSREQIARCQMIAAAYEAAYKNDN